ncbi:amidohydrolase family protein [Candidatus Palauibacter sp.]|uniref:amidohydrolase family protein n=1 Tax=Candidatus Palauibacter sp. TaxID=3101350 RepID=UPI003B02B59D
MRSYRQCLGFALAACALAPFAAAGEQAAQTGATAFVDVNVIAMDSERVLTGQTVVVRGDRIMAVGPSASVEVPGGAERIDGAGKYLMPGLSEMHGHTPGSFPSDEFREQVMFLYAANGVTTVRGMLGLPGDLDLKAKTNTGEIWGPTLYLAGPSFSGGSISSVEQAVERVRTQKREGWDHLKIHPGLTVPQYDAMAATAAQAGMRFSGHVPADVGLRHAILMGQETFDHLDGYMEAAGGIRGPMDEAEMDELFDLTIAARAWVVPTMVLWEVGVIGLGDPDALAAYPEMRYWPPQGVQGWKNRLQAIQARDGWDVEQARLHASNRTRLLGMMNEAGVGILMGTDSPQMFSVPGFSIHRELEAMAEAGMTPYEILVSGTRAVGDYFQRYDSFGTVAAGRRADLILTNSNPLDDVANIADRAGVMVRGVWKSEEEIQQGLAAIAASFGN